MPEYLVACLEMVGSWVHCRAPCVQPPDMGASPLLGSLTDTTLRVSLAFQRIASLGMLGPCHACFENERLGWRPELDWFTDGAAVCRTVQTCSHDVHITLHVSPASPTPSACCSWPMCTACLRWHQRLERCVHAEGGHDQYMLNLPLTWDAHSVLCAPEAGLFW